VFPLSGSLGWKNYSYFLTRVVVWEKKATEKNGHQRKSHGFNHQSSSKIMARAAVDGRNSANHLKCIKTLQIMG